MQMITRLCKFLQSKKSWIFPKCVDFIIYDNNGVELLDKFLIGKNYQILYVRGEYWFMPVLIYSFFYKSFWRGKFKEAYVDAYIKIAKAKVALTFTDNDVIFLKLAKKHEGLKTLSIQNGLRDDWLRINLKKNTKDFVNYMFLHNQALADYYDEYIDGEKIVAGSLRNNSIKINRNGPIKDAVLYISQYPSQDGPDVVYTNSNGRKFSISEFFYLDTLVLKQLVKWCQKNQKKLYIAGRAQTQYGCEYVFYNNILNGYKNWSYHPKLKPSQTYSLVDNVEFVVTIDSTMGYESFVRGAKTVFFSCRGNMLNDPSRNFGWPFKFGDNGPFWTNLYSQRKVKKILDFIKNINDYDWQVLLKKYQYTCMVYDKQNIMLKKVLNNVLDKH